jgi:small redox-active disulfide protein 2
VEIKILGTGCPNCRKLEQVALQAVAESGLDVKVTEVTDIEQIMSYPIASTPALVIDEKVKSFGRIPKKEQIIAWIKEAGGQ